MFFRNTPAFNDYCSRQGKRAVRRCPPPLQAHHREARPLDRSARARVLREANGRAQAQEGRSRQAPLQAGAQHAAAEEALLTGVAASPPEARATRASSFLN